MSSSSFPSAAASTAASATSAAASASPTWDPGVSAAPEVETSSDYRGFLAIMTATALSFVLTGFIIRNYVRITVGGFKTDDWVLTSASVFAVIQAIVVFVQISKGFGEQASVVSIGDYEPMLKAFFASTVLSLPTLLFSKLSTAFIFLRLTPERKHSIAAWTTIACCALFFAVSLLLLTVRCHVSAPWFDISVAQCADLYTRFAAATVTSIVTEVVLFSLSIYLVWHLKMSRKNKLIVVSAFAARLGVLVPLVFRLLYLGQSLSSADPTFGAGVSAVVCTQFEIGYGILASTIPCLKPFMSAYEGPLRPAARTHYYRDGYYAGGGYAAGDNYKLSNLSASEKRGSRSFKRGSTRINGAPASGKAGIEGDLRIYGVEKGARTVSASGPSRGIGSGGRSAVNSGGKGRKSLESDDSMRAIIHHGRGDRWSGDIGVAVGGAEEAMVIKKEVQFSVESSSNPSLLHQRDEMNSKGSAMVTVTRIERGSDGDPI